MHVPFIFLCFEPIPVPVFVLVVIFVCGNLLFPLCVDVHSWPKVWHHSKNLVIITLIIKYDFLMKGTFVKLFRMNMIHLTKILD